MNRLMTIAAVLAVAVPCFAITNSTLVTGGRIIANVGAAKYPAAAMPVITTDYLALEAGNAANLTNLNGASIASGNIPVARMTNAFPGAATVTAALGANNLVGMTNMNATGLVGQVQAANLALAFPLQATLAVSNAVGITNLSAPALIGQVPAANVTTIFPLQATLAVSNAVGLTNISAAAITPTIADFSVTNASSIMTNITYFVNGRAVSNVFNPAP